MDKSSLRWTMGLCCLVLTLLLSGSVAMADEAFPLASALADSPQGVELGSGWKFHSGDDMAWAAPGFDDTAWEKLEHPNLKSAAFAYQGWDGKGWFRLRIATPPEFADKPYAFFMSQMGASEVYLDGILVRKFGVVGTPDTPEQEYNPGTSHATLVFSSAPEHVIAVRYSCQAIPRLARGLYALPNVSQAGVGFTPMIAAIAPDSPSTQDLLAYSAGVHFGMAAFAFGIGAIQFVAYLVFGRRKDHLYCAAFAMAFAVMVALSFFQAYGHFGAQGQVLFGVVVFMMYFVAGAAYIAFLSTALDPQGPSNAVALLSVPIVVSIAMLVFPEVAAVSLFVLFIMLIWLYVRMGVAIWRAAKEQKRAWHILALNVFAWIGFQALFLVGPALGLSLVVAGILLLSVVAMILILPSAYLLVRVASRHEVVEGRYNELSALYDARTAEVLSKDRRETP